MGGTMFRSGSLRKANDPPEQSEPLEVKIFLEGKGTEMGGTMFRTGSLRKANNPLEQSEPLVQKEIPVD